MSMWLTHRVSRLVERTPIRVLLVMALVVVLGSASVARGAGVAPAAVAAAGIADAPVAGATGRTVDGGAAPLSAAQVPTATATPVAPAYVFRTGQDADRVLGQTGFAGSGEATTQTGLKGPQGVTVDPTTGKVFVVDTFNSRVLRYAAIGLLANGAAAEAVLGRANFTSGGAPSTSQSGLGFPVDATVDVSGRLWVADTDNNRVLRFDNAATKANGAPADGVLGQPAYATKTYGAGRNGLSQPTGVAVDSAGRLWVVDVGNNRVLRFDSAASKPNGANADGVLGQADFTGNAATTSQTGLSPTGLAVDADGRLWVADFANNRVVRFDDAASKPNGAPADGVLGQADFTSQGAAASPSGMNLPTGLAVGSNDRLWVADARNNRVLWFDDAASKPNGAPADGALGQSTLTGNAAAAGQAGLAGPTRLAIDGMDNVWVADRSNNRALHFASRPVTPTPTPIATPTPTPTDTPTPRPTDTPTPAPSTPAASAPGGGPGFANGQPADLVLGQPDFTTNRPSTSQRGLSLPIDVAVDPTTGKVFVADTFNRRVLRFGTVAGLSHGAPAEAVLGQSDFTRGVEATTQSGVHYPNSLAVDSGGRLWVVDGDNNRVLRFDNAASKPNGAPADGVLGQPGFTDRTAAGGPAGLSQPASVAVDGAGRLWVADAGNHRVLRFDNAASLANGASADDVLGQPDFTSRDSATSAGGMNKPAGLAVDGAGRLWVVDTDNHRVLRFDNAAAKANGAEADGVLGQPDFAGSAPATTRSGLNGPRDAAIDSGGRLWVTDDGNNRLLWFDNAASQANGAEAAGVLGQAGFTSDAAATTPSGLHRPVGVAVDAAGTVWVADSLNHRVLHYTGSPARP